MASYDTYLVWNIVVPALFAGVMWLLSFAVVLVYCFKKDKLPRIFMEMLQLSLSNIEEDSNCACVLVFGSRIRARALKLLTLLVVPLTLATIFFSFWNVWLVEEETSTNCLPNFDCFPMLGDRQLKDTPVNSCSEPFKFSTLADNDATETALDNLNGTDILNDTETREMVAADEISYRCYRFVFLYAEGIGAAGGILFFTAVFSKLYFCFLVTIICSKRHDYLRFGVLFFVWIFAAVVWVLFIVVNTAVPIIREAVFQTHTDTIQFTLYAVNFAAVVVGGYVVSIGVMCV